MELKSSVNKIHWPQNREYKYKLSGLGGTGDLSITYATTKDIPNINRELDEKFIVHVKCVAKLSFLASFHFEGLSVWEESQNGYDFVSYSEKDFSKDIHKKWEMLADGLNYIENKKGLVLEREVQYFNTPETVSRIFDPISAVTVALIESPNRDVNIFGKQRILQLKTQKVGELLKVESIEGVSDTWSKILGTSKITLDSNNMILEMEIPSPLQIGKIKMQFDKQDSIKADSIGQIVKPFIG